MPEYPPDALSAYLRRPQPLSGFVRKLIPVAALACISPLLAACRDVSVPVETAHAVEVAFDQTVPRRHPSAVHTYSLKMTVSREVVDTIAKEQLYTFAHVTRCARRDIIAVAETQLGNIDLIDFDALQRRLDKDAAGQFQLNAKFSSQTRLRSGEACVAFDGGSYSAGQATSAPIPITVENPPKHDAVK